MRRNIILMVSLMMIVGLFSFKTIEKPFLPTKLKITVLDGLGNLTEGAKVTIFKTETDYTNNENPVATGITDAKGRVVFKNLEPIIYYVYAYKGDMNNNGEGVKISTLEEGKMNIVNTIIE